MKVLSKLLVLGALLAVTVTIVHGNSTLLASHFDSANSPVTKGNRADRGNPKDFPYIAHIEYPNKPNVEYCLGAIVHQRWVLTTAGCTRFIAEPEQNTVVVGYGLKGKEDGVRYDVERVVSSEESLPDGSHNGNSFILVKTKKPIKFNKRVNLIKLNKTVVKGDKRALMARWQLVCSISFVKLLCFWMLLVALISMFACFF